MVESMLGIKQTGLKIYNREVFIFPDNDDAGKKCANEIARHLKQNGCSVSIAHPPKDFNDKDDLYDAYDK